MKLYAAFPDGHYSQQYFLTHARVLRALGRDDEADGYLQRAYERVMLVASKIQDESLHQSWLENAIDNREIVAEWEGGGSKSEAMRGERSHRNA